LYYSVLISGNDEQRALEELAKRRRRARGLARRERIVLGAAASKDNKAIAREVEAGEKTVGKWRRRFAAERADGLHGEPCRGAPQRIGDDEIAETIRLTLETAPPGPTHWSLRSIARTEPRALDDPSDLTAFCPQPHRTETFNLPTGPQFVEKVREIDEITRPLMKPHRQFSSSRCRGLARD
jgi:transposase